MILFFSKGNTVFAVDARKELSKEDLSRLMWLFGEDAKRIEKDSVEGVFVGPRREMISPWSSNAVEVVKIIGVEGIIRLECYEKSETENPVYDKMLQRKYVGLNQDVFMKYPEPQPIVEIDNIEAYDKEQGLALSPDEIDYLEDVSKKIGRKLTDSEVFGFSQVNSEHCRHKIFNGQFIIDGKEKDKTLFSMIKDTTKKHNGRVVSAYTDNCAFLQGPMVQQFAPKTHEGPDYFTTKDFESVLALKAETHNFPTTVEPYNGGATGSGGEIRDRVGGGKGAFPLAGICVYMTSYSRLEEGREWEKHTAPRKWLYQTPEEILMKASNGASDYGNIFGQPLICGAMHTFEHNENGKKFGFDKVIMMAGGLGFGYKKDSQKGIPVAGDKVVMMGGDNLRIGMGGGAGSSVATGEYDDSIEINAIQRSNPEIQKRVINAIRAVAEEDVNPIVSIHDHGAGGHLNCLSELVEASGGRIDIDKLPVGDPSLSYKEIIGNESQERMGLVVKDKDIPKFQRISERERAPFYIIGEATNDKQLTFIDNKTGKKPVDLKLEYLLGKSPRTIMEGKTIKESYAEPKYDKGLLVQYLENVLQIDAVACKDWLINKVDRSVTGRVAIQQTNDASIQVPLNDYGAMALDYKGKVGVATALGQAPVIAMADERKGSIMAITEALTNIVFAPIEGGLGSISLSANWMWPAKNAGEDARLYNAVEAASEYSLELGINIPTGKDSLSMTQKYPDGDKVYSPGTVIITSMGEVSDVQKCVTVPLKNKKSQIVYVDMSRCGFGIGGSSFAQVLGSVGMDVPSVESAEYFAGAFGAVQALINEKAVFAGHDVSAGGLVTALLEMTFGDNKTGVNVNIDTLAKKFGETDIIKLLFSEKPAVLLQVENGAQIAKKLADSGVDAYVIGDVNRERKFTLAGAGVELELKINDLRDKWFRTSYLYDIRQSGEKRAAERFTNYKNQELTYKFPESFTGKLSQWGLQNERTTTSGIRAAVIREKGNQCERELAWAMHLAGMDVKDVHMTDLETGRETLEDVNMIVFVDGHSSSDVFGGAKGWVGAFKYNDKAMAALNKFYARKDTLSMGVGNGAQLMVQLGLITPADEKNPHIGANDSGKFESGFINVDIMPSNSVMLSSLAGSRLGVWSSHDAGKFELPYPESHYSIPMKYGFAEYPANPNGSDFNAAAIASEDGRHLALMPNMQRGIRPWNWAFYPEDRATDEVTPWIEAFANATQWIKGKK